MPPRRFDWKSLAVLLVLGPLALASLAWGARNAIRDSGDLTRRAQEVRLLANRESPYRDRDATYPPPAYPVFAALVGPVAGSDTLLRSTWLVLNLAALACVIRLCLKHAGRRWSPAWKLTFALITLASKPVRLTLGMGQYSLLPLCFMLLAYDRRERGHDAASGGWTALALIKPTMSLPWLSDLATSAWGRRRWLAIAVAFALLLSGWLGLAIWLGQSPSLLVRDWLNRASTQQAAGAIDLPALAARMGLARRLPATVAMLGIWAAGTVVLAVYRQRPGWNRLALALFLAAIFTYHRPYDLVLLIVPFAVACQEAASGRSWWHALPLGLFSLVLVAPSHPAVIDEALYQRLVIPTTYLLLAHTFTRLAWPMADGRGGKEVPTRSPSDDGRACGS